MTGPPKPAPSGGPFPFSSTPSRSRKHSKGSRGREDEDEDGDEYDDQEFLDVLAAMPLTPLTTSNGKAKHIEPAAESKESLVEDEEEMLPMTQWNLADIYPDDAPVKPDQDFTSPVPSSKKRKMTRFESLEDRNQVHQVKSKEPSSSNAQGKDYRESTAYDAISYGDFSRYMKNKRAKLKVQEASLKEQEEALLAAADASKSGRTQQSRPDDHAADHSDTTAPIASPPSLFKGCTMYITGHTNPPYAELRRLIVLHGGDFMAYMDQKSPITHIIASNLTPKKRVEFKDCRVAKPEWITESIKAGRRLPWSDFKVDSDAGGAIGFERLPSGRSSDTSQVAGNNFLVNPASAQQNRSTAVVRGRPDLADANPWGRASAQKKLSGFKPAAPFQQQAKQPLQKSADPRPIKTPEVTTPDEPIEAPLEVLEDGDKGRPKTPSPPPARAADSSQLTAEEEEWLGSLETPPRKRLAHDADTPKKNDSPETPTPSDTPTTPITPVSATKASSVTPTAANQIAPVDEPKTPRKTFEAAIGTDPVTRAAAKAAGHNESSHPYVKRPSNTHAAKLLASPSWRERNTATSESFLSGFFAKSRLHYLSTWKGELKDLVSQALKDAGRAEGSQVLPKGMSRVIMHVDFDSFFVSVGLRDRPDLRDKPVVVCHAGSVEGGGNAGVSSTSEIASCNYVARQFGVHNGWSLGRARQVCAHVQTIPYDFEAYKNISIDFYSLMLLHADAIEAVSVDEALIDVSRLLSSMRQAASNSEIDGQGEEDEQKERRELISAYRNHISSQGEEWTAEKQLAEALRDEIRRQTKCEASIGIGSNTLLARLATRHAKPGGSYHLRDEDVEDFIGKLDVDDLQGVGYNTRHRFQSVFGTANIGELKSRATESKFVSELGPKLGKQVWSKMHGIDRSELEGAKQRQSVGAAVNYGIRFANIEEASKFVQNLSDEVSSRLRNYQLRGRQCNVTVMIRDAAAPVEAPKFLGHGVCDVFNRSTSLGGLQATDDAISIYRSAWKLIKGLNAEPRDLRGIAISCTKLESTTATSAVVKPKGGQSLLNFQRTPQKPQTPSRLRLSPVQAQDDPMGESDEDGDDVEGQELQAGPLEDFPPGTQPLRRASMSPEVESSRNQTITPRGKEAPVRSTPRTTVLNRLRTPGVQRAQSAELPATSSQTLLPETGEEDGTETMAASTSAAAASPGFLPSMSQLDQSVLKELPPSIRAEVLRESKKLSMGRKASMVRSVSASPSKRKNTSGNLSNFFLKPASKVATTKPKPAPKNANTSASASGSPSSSHHEAVRTKTGKDATAGKTPSQMTSTDLQALEIDPEVFSALPATMQREILLEQSRTVRGRESRFIVGGSSRGGEKTLSEERRNATDRAALQACGGDVGGSGLDLHGQERSATLFRAVRKRALEDSLPSIQKRSSTSEISSLLTTWIKGHRSQKPRTNDVIRIKTFLVDSIEIDLNKVHELLLWWKLELQRVQPKSEDDKIACGWWEAFDKVVSDVNAVVKKRFGGRLSV
ncbi:unnamed protein product [Sympodiomycopsis kandeliae]